MRPSETVALTLPKSIGGAGRDGTLGVQTTNGTGRQRTLTCFAVVWDGINTSCATGLDGTYHSSRRDGAVNIRFLDGSGRYICFFTTGRDGTIHFSPPDGTVFPQREGTAYTFFGRQLCGYNHAFHVNFRGLFQPNPPGKYCQAGEVFWSRSNSAPRTEAVPTSSISGGGACGVIPRG